MTVKAMSISAKLNACDALFPLRVIEGFRSRAAWADLLCHRYHLRHSIGFDLSPTGWAAARFSRHVSGALATMVDLICGVLALTANLSLQPC